MLRSLLPAHFSYFSFIAHVSYYHFVLFLPHGSILFSWFLGLFQVMYSHLKDLEPFLPQKGKGHVAFVFLGQGHLIQYTIF